MPVLNWGDLAKSQEDPETIEEAIARIIAEHNDDEESHLGEGQSLEAHKGAEIIDHLQGSVLGDKFSNREFFLSFPFESLDEYSKSGAGISNDIAGYRLETGATINTERYLKALAQYSNTYYNIGRDVTFQFYAHFTSITNQIAYILAGGNIIEEGAPGVGFKVLNGTLYAVESVWGVEDFIDYTSEITGIDITGEHIYRVQTITAENKAYFYVDGVLKATLTLHTNDDVGLVMWSSYLKNTAAEQKYVWIHGVYISINVNPPI